MDTIQRISADEATQAFYENCLSQGCTHKLAEALALRQFPATTVEAGQDSFFRGRYGHKDLDKMPATVRQKFLDRAKQAGVSIQGKVYISGLADSPGDPKAWVSHESEVMERCKAEGWTAQGVHNYDPPEPALPTSLTRPMKRIAKKQRREAQRAQRKLS